jgi:beta-phosphoglucomutase family hydrolase
MPYQACIFDMDGTLVDNMGFHHVIWSEFLASIGSPTDPETFYRRTVGKVNSEILRDLVRPDLTDAEVAAYSLRKEELYRARFKPSQAVVPGLVDYLHRLRAAGLPLALATSAGRENVAFVLRELGIEGVFAALVTAEEITRGKPDPEIFLLAAERLGVAPAACLVFEDSPSGLEAAHSAGMRSIALTTTFPAERLRGCPGVLRVVENYLGLEVIS